MMVANSMIRSLHAARSRAGMDEELFRDWLEQNYGTRHVSELGADAPAALRVLNSKAGDAPKRAGRKSLEGPYAKKLQALWLSAWNLGVVKNRADEAMLAFIERQTGIQRTEFLRDEADANKVVEALKKWLEREAGVDWSHDRYRPDYKNSPQYKIVFAQMRKLHGRASARELNAEIVCALGTSDLDRVARHEWIDLQQLLGEKIRGAK